MRNQSKKGVLLVNLGTPDSPSRKDVYKYLKQFLLDPRVIDISWLSRQILVRGIIAPFRSKDSAKLYQRLWTEEGSPLKFHGERLANEIQSRLKDTHEVVLAMRYQSPSIEKGLNHFKENHINDILILPLFPQYASASTGSVYEEVMRIISKWQTVPNLKMINSFHDEPEMIKVFASNAKKMNLDQYDHFVFSFHGLPIRQLQKADNCNHCYKKEDCCSVFEQHNSMCYSAQCHDTARKIAAELGLQKNDFSISFQSRLGRDPWTKPYTQETLANLVEEQKKRVLVFSPAFVADCLETTVEIAYEYREEFIEAGGDQLDLVPSLNEDPKWVEFLTNFISTN